MMKHARKMPGASTGIGDTSYLVDKGIPVGEKAMLNKLPPGMNIERQETALINEQEMKLYQGGCCFPGDGWDD